MKFLYLDLGLYRCTEMKWMVDDILPSLGISNYEAHGFEPCHIHATTAQDHFCKYKNVTIHKIAIGGFDGAGKLYHARNKLGHSIFSTKNNVDKRDFEVIIVRKFSTWIQRNNIDLENTFVMMKVNIEGAEFVFFQDLIKSNLLKHMNIICGAIDDVKKIKGYADKVDEYYKMLREYRVRCIPFTEYQPRTKEHMREYIYEVFNFMA